MPQLRDRLAPLIFLMRDRSLRSTGPNLAKSTLGQGSRSRPAPPPEPPLGAVAAWALVCTVPAMTDLVKAWMSSAVMRPLLPEPLTSSSGTPSSRANLRTDRKSTRLNSSHLVISYAVFCLKIVVLVVAEAVGMDADRPPRAVQEVDEDGVPDLRADDRPEDAEPWGLRRLGGEGAVGVLDVARLLPLGPIGLRDGAPVHEIPARRRKVPDDLLGCDEVIARRAAGRGGEGEQQERDGAGGVQAARPGADGARRRGRCVDDAARAARRRGGEPFGSHWHPPRATSSARTGRGQCRSTPGRNPPLARPCRGKLARGWRRLHAGSCCVMQWSEPSPSTRSPAWMPTTRRPGKSSASVSSA